MRRPSFAFALPFVLALALVPTLAAQPSNAIDVLVTLTPNGVPEIDGPAGLIRFVNGTQGEHLEFALTLPRNYTTFEFRAHGFDITGPRQLVPSLRLPETEYPLFYEFPTAEIWGIDSPARVFHVSGTAEDAILRLGVDGPTNVTLILDRDVTPPTFALGTVENLTHFSFYQETTTDELAIGDLQVRKKGATEWVVNPTPLLHFRQRFPVQGLQSDSEYEARVVFTDWAGNNVTSGIYSVRTVPAPFAPLPSVTAISPTPNATLPAGTITVRARIDSNESTISSGGVRLFFDLQEVTEGATFDGREIVYTPQALGPGRHVVSVEATNDAGGKDVERWTFEVLDPNARGAPMPGGALLLAVVALAALVLRRRG